MRCVQQELLQWAVWEGEVMRNWEVVPLDWAIARESTWEGELEG